MAELINEIVSPEAFKQVEQLKTDLAGLTKQMETLLKAMNSAPTGGSGGLKQTTKELQDVANSTKELTKIQREIQTATQRLNDLHSQEGKELALVKEQLRQYNAELRASAKEQTQAEGSLDQMRSKLNQLEKLYSAMSAEMRNAKVGQTIFADMVKAKEGVTLLEQSMGNYKRNVGNYTNSTFQLTQVLRELPAFAYSAQGGLMGISNNLPMLADAFGKVKQETGSTMGAIKVFGASLFSFNNIFAIGIGLATAFLPRLIEWASSTKNVANAYKDLDEAQKEGQKNAIKEQASLETLYKTMTNTNKSMSERLLAVDKLQSQYPDYFGNLSKEDLLVGNASVAYQNLRNDILSVAKARAIEDKIATIYTETLDEELRLKEEMRKADALSAVDRNKQIEIQTRGGLDKELRTQKLSIEASNKHREDKKRIAFAEYQDFLATREAQLKVLKDAVQKETTIINTGGGGLGKTTKDKPQAKPVVVAPNLDEGDLEAIKKYYDELEKAFEQAWKEQKPFFEERVIADIQDSMDTLVAPTLPEVEANELNALLMNRGAKREEDKKKEQEHLDNIIKNVQTATQLLNGIADLGSAFIDRKIAEIDAQQKKMEEYYDVEYEKLNQLTLSDEERAKRKSALDAQKRAEEKRFEAERLQAERKQAAVQKAANIANIISSTALAVIKAWTEGDPYTKLPRSIAAGVIGGVQLATAIAAPLPQFAEGTQNAPEGYAIVGERGTELVVNPDGTSWLTPAKDTLTYLKKGSKVIPNDELLDMVKNSTHIALANTNTAITPDSYGLALVAKFEEMADEMRALKQVMANKDMRVQIEGNYDHYMHVRKNIR